MKSNVLNNDLNADYIFTYPSLNAVQIRQIKAGLFEQLLLFDKVTLTTNRVNYSLFFLINEIGLNNTEELIERGVINFLLWSPVLVTYGENKTENEVINKKSPIAAGELSDDDTDPEHNIDAALSILSIHQDRKRILKKKALKNYIIPEGMHHSVNSKEIVIDAYKNNILSNLGLPFEKEPEKLNFEERVLLLKLGHKVLETAILSEYSFKSYENYSHYQIAKQNIDNIGKAYNVAENIEGIMELENLPDLKTLFLTQRMNFGSVLNLRELRSSKYFRKWLNEVSESSDAKEITKEYINEIKGDNKFFNKNEGKFVKFLGSYGINATLGTLLAGPAGTVAGITLGLLETFILDKILEGKNPQMFIKEIEKIK